MSIPIQITFRGLPTSNAVEQSIQRHAARLERFHSGINACHITVDQPHHHRHQGNHYRVQVELGVPGASLVVTRGDTDDVAYEDVNLVIRDAFNAALRRLEQRLQRPRAQRRARLAAPNG